MLKIQFRMFISLCIALLIGGCSSLDLGFFLQSYDDIQAAETEAVSAEAVALLDQEKALETLQLLDTSGIPATKLQRHHTMAINLLVEQGREFYHNEDFLRAGGNFRVASDHYPDNMAIQTGPESSKEEILHLINLCADRLLETGLLAYRNGQLQEAIDVWAQIRHFHPDYKASQQAIQTTRKQLKNLEQIKNPG